MLGVLANMSRRLLAVSVLCGVIGGLGATGLIYLITNVLYRDGAIAERNVVTFVVVLAVVTACGLASQFCLIRLGQEVMFDLRMDLCRRILATPFCKLEEIGTSRLYATLTDDIQSLVNAAQSLPHLVINGATLVGGFVYLYWLSPAIFLISMAFVAVGIVSYQMLVRLAVHELKRARDVNDSLFCHLRAITSGIKELKLNHARRDRFLSDELEPAGAAYRHRNVRGLTTFALAAQWGQLMFFGVIGMLIFQRPIVSDSTSGTLTGAVLTVIYLIGPFGVILNLLPALGRAGVARKKIESLELAPLPATDRPPVVSNGASDLFSGIELLGATYVYPGASDEAFRLGPIDLALQPGEVVFLVGGNGSGKSTLLKLMTGLYTPENGEIRVNGEPVAGEFEWDSYRQLFSTVFADFHLFERLPAEAGCDTDALALAHLDELQLGGKVDVNNGRLSTVSLSQGQRKRLALLCAYLEDRPVYIFDEWAADQDPVFKDIFYRRILPDLKRRTKAVLVATHDDRYFHLADRIIKLESGQILS